MEAFKMQVLLLCFFALNTMGIFCQPTDGNFTTPGTVKVQITDPNDQEHFKHPLFANRKPTANTENSTVITTEIPKAEADTQQKGTILEVKGQKALIPGEDNNGNNCNRSDGMCAKET